jgi:hypothetical protein
MVGMPEIIRRTHRARVRNAFTIMGPPIESSFRFCPFVDRALRNEDSAENSEAVLACAMRFSTHSAARQLCL